MRLSITNVAIIKPVLCLFLYSFYRKSDLNQACKK